MALPGLAAGEEKMQLLVLRNILAVSKSSWVVAFSSVYFQTRWTLLFQLLNPLTTVSILYREYRFQNARALAFPPLQERLQPSHHKY